MNQVLLHSPCHVWSHVFVVLTSPLNSFHDYDACTVFHELQEIGLSHLSYDEVGLVVQIIHKIVENDLSLFITNWEFDALINSYDYYFVSDGCRSCYHFPTSIPNGSYFSSFHLHQ